MVVGNPGLAVDAPWRRWTLLAALLILGLGYVAAYALFRARSENFLVTQHNLDAEEYSRAHPIAPPRKLTFGTDADGNPYLGGGWYPPAGGGAWSTLNDAWVLLAIAPTDADLAVTLQMNVALAQKTPRNRITISANEQILGTWERDTATAAEPIRLRIPSTILHRGLLRLRLHAEHVWSLRDMGSSDDGLLLGVRLGVLLNAVELESASPSDGAKTGSPGSSQ